MPPTRHMRNNRWVRELNVSRDLRVGSVVQSMIEKMFIEQALLILAQSSPWGAI